MGKQLFIACLILVSWSGITHADENFITVYNNDLGLVKQVRSLEINEDGLPLYCTDVAAKLIPTSVHLRCLNSNSGFRVLEQNFEYDLVSSDRILEKYIDQSIEIIRESGDLIRGTLLSKQGRSMVVQTPGGIRIVPWNDSLSVIVKDLPEGLITRPTLVWEFISTTYGKEYFEVSYLTRGMNWHAEYVGVLNEDGTGVNMNAWVSVDNRSGATFRNSRLKLVAGEIHRVPTPMMLQREMKKADAIMVEGAGAPGFKEREFFDYHLYELERSTTIKNNQIKQISLFPPVSIKSEKRYYYNAGRDPRRVEARILFRNDEEAGLGKPLPAGIFRVYQKDVTGMEFVGEDSIDHTPRNEEVRITLGKAFDLVGERNVISRSKISKRSERSGIEIELGNNKKEDDVTIIVEEDLQCQDWEVEKSNFPAVKKNIHRVEFHVPVRAGGRTTLQYTVLCSR